MDFILETLCVCFYIFTLLLIVAGVGSYVYDLYAILVGKPTLAEQPSTPKIDPEALEDLQRYERLYSDKDPDDECAAFGCHTIGLDWVYGVSYPKDVKRGLRLIKRAANFGYPPSLVFLGDYYSEVDKIDENERKGFLYYQKAAELGSAVGMFKLGACYMLGCGVEHDDGFAPLWISRSADNGFAPGRKVILDFCREVFKGRDACEEAINKFPRDPDYDKAIWKWRHISGKIRY